MPASARPTEARNPICGPASPRRSPTTPNTGDWTLFDDVEAEAAESSLDWIDGGAPGPGEVSIQIHAGQDLLLVRESLSGAFFCVAQIRSNPATLRGGGATFADVDTIAECSNGW